MKGFLVVKICTLFFLMLLVSRADGTTTNIWAQSTESEFDKGVTQNVSIHSTGEIRLSPKTEAVTGIKSAFVWSMASDLQNQVFVGTGDPGTVYCIKNGSEAVELFKSPELYVQSVICDKHGNLYAGTSPRGVIYKINNKGEASVFCSLPAAYIWDMAVDNDSNLFAATGNEGILFKISPDGIPAVFLIHQKQTCWIFCLINITMFMPEQNQTAWFIRLHPQERHRYCTMRMKVKFIVL